jgi:hypothetical protein
MAARTGKDGFITFGTSSSGAGSSGGTTEKPTYIDSWSFTADVAMTEVTAFGDYYKQFQPTVRGWTGSAGGTLDRSSTDQQVLALLKNIDTTQAPMSIFVRMYETTAYWFSKANLTGVTVNSAVADKVSVTYNITGTTGLSYITT